MKINILITDNGETIEVPEEAKNIYDFNELIEFIGHRRAVVAYEEEEEGGGR